MAKKDFPLITDEGTDWIACKSFKKTMKEQNATVVLFFSQDCGPCAEVIQEFQKVGDHPGVAYAAIDVGVCDKVADGQQVDETPTIVVNSRGNEVYRLAMTGNIKTDLATLNGFLNTLA